MASIDRYSLDFDPEFEEMLEQMGKSSLHSSINECSATAVNSGLRSYPDCHIAYSPASPIKNCAVTTSPSLSFTQEDDEDEIDSSEFDLNATLNAKTVSRRKLSAILEALRESETESSLETIPTGGNCIASPNVAVIQKSPHTPQNQMELVPDRSYRLTHVRHRNLTISMTQGITNEVASTF